MKNRKFIEVKINDRYSIKYKNVKITGFRELEEYESLESLFEVRILTESIIHKPPISNEKWLIEKNSFDAIKELFKPNIEIKQELEIFVDELPMYDTGYSNHGWFTFRCNQAELDLKNNTIICK